MILVWLTFIYDPWLLSLIWFVQTTNYQVKRFFYVNIEVKIKIFVITSYSIHYTKLYDPLQNGISKNFFCITTKKMKGMYSANRRERQLARQNSSFWNMHAGGQAQKGLADAALYKREGVRNNFV